MQKTMKIIQVIPMFNLSGAQTMCANLACELKKKGNDVMVISLYNYHSSLTQMLNNHNIRIVYLNKKKGLHIGLIGQLYKILIKEKPNVIHTHMNSIKYAMPAAFLAGVKIKIHTMHSIANKDTTSLLEKKVYTFIFHLLNVVPVALSETVKNSIVTYYCLSNKQVPIIMNGTDITHCIVKDDYSIKKPFVFLHIGRFDYVKNHQGMIEAFEKFHLKYKESELWLIGEGDLFSNMKCFVLDKHLEKSIKFLGLQKNVYTYLTSADCFILPSYYEGIPITIIEAMGTGLPIIATNVGGIPDMLNDGIDSLLVNNNINDISNAMTMVYKDSNLRRKIGINARKSSTKFTSIVMASNYYNLYNELMLDNNKY